MRTDKQLLIEHNQKQYQTFLLNDDKQLALPIVSIVPGIAARKNKKNVFIKKIVSCGGESQVCFVQKTTCDKNENPPIKNAQPHTFLWKSSAEKIKEGVRWGIIKTESISGKVIAALGQYRITAHERIAKGMISNTQALKLKLLDNYQDRFELLHELESLVNKPNEIGDYAAVFKQYIEKLTSMKDHLEDGLFKDQLEKDLMQDITNAQAYLKTIQNDKQSLRKYHRSRGQASILEFVKQQMMRNLYEFQGINQDLTYSRKRWFALTRGDLNDAIEDAKKEIDEYGSDPRNTVELTHHGYFGDNKTNRVAYDFSKDHLTPKQERAVLLAISFIERWDEVKVDDPKYPFVKSKMKDLKNKKASLETIYAPRWRRHRTIKVLLKSLAWYVWNIIKGVFVTTKPWREEAWEESDFHLTAWKLQKYARPREPLWYKPFKVLKNVFSAVSDVFTGIYDFAKNLIFQMPRVLVNDWASTNPLPTLKETFTAIHQEVKLIQKNEKQRLDILLKNCPIKQNQSLSQSDSLLATQAYPLSGAAQNDILNALLRGVDGFSSLFTHNIFAKDPVGGLLFTAAYAVGAGAIFLPAFTAKVLGAGYVKWFTGFAHSMGTSRLISTVAGGSTQAQMLASAWDVLIHGPSSQTAQTVSMLAEDPVTAATYFSLAYGLGYVLVNGINGHPIPWLSKTLKEDLGSKPELSYPLIGGKVAFGFYEVLLPQANSEYQACQLSYHGQEHGEQNFVKTPQHLLKIFQNKTLIQRFFIVQWLNQNAAVLPYLKRTTQALLIRHIDKLFSFNEAKSLKKLIYPQKARSIAFQLFYIPLSYISALSRVLASVFLSLTAWAIQKTYPWEPVKNATADLRKKIVTDLHRLLQFVSHAVYLAYKVSASLVKMVAYTLNMILARIASLVFNQKISHALHRGFASVHNFFRTLGEFFYPARAAKSVAVAHPQSVIKNVEISYGKMVASLKKSSKKLSDQTFKNTIFDLFPHNASKTNIISNESNVNEIDLESDAITFK